MEAKVGTVVHMADIQEPKKFGEGTEAESNYQRDLKKFKEEQAEGIKKKLYISVADEYRAVGKILEQNRIYEMKVKDGVAKIGDRLLIQGSSYQVNGKLGFQKSAKIEVLPKK